MIPSLRNRNGNEYSASRSGEGVEAGSHLIFFGQKQFSYILLSQKGSLSEWSFCSKKHLPSATRNFQQVVQSGCVWGQKQCFVLVQNLYMSRGLVRPIVIWD